MKTHFGLITAVMCDSGGLFPQPPPARVVCWFSCGAPSAVAARLTLTEYPQAEIVRLTIGSEHVDADRFSADVSAWLRRPIICIRSARFTDHFEAILKARYVNGPTGAKCTRELKRKVREAYQLPGDLHVFGFDAEEQSRVDDFRENNPGIDIHAPLADAGLTKSDCKRIVEAAGIELPAMYRMGYANANCVGCVKGGMGYWNRIRTDFPDVFAKMARIERDIGATILKHRKGPHKGERYYLDELDPTAGRFETDQPGDCGPLCQVALERVGLS